MKMFVSSKLRQAVRHIQKRLAPKAAILMYHRVADADLDPWCLCVTPQHFAEHLSVLQQCARPLSLKQLVHAYKDGNIPDRAVVVTFDDGYADNLHNAKPLLERYNIPATFFVSTGHIGKKCEFWWDELEQLLLQPGKLPNKLQLKINGTTHQWDLGKESNYSEEEYLFDKGSKAWKAKPGSRLFFYYSIWQLLQPLSEKERRQVLDEILIWVSCESIARPTHRSLLKEELSTLAQGKLIEIGAHTVTHPFLCALPAAVQWEEIQQSKAELEKILNLPVTSFSYPFGNRTAETVELTRLAGFDCACSTVEDIVWQQSECFELPRFAVENWNGSYFAKQLSRWFDGGKNE